MSLIKDEVDGLFRQNTARNGELCDNPITGGRFIKGESGEDSIAHQKRQARIALFAREWFALHGPAGAPPLPLTHADREDMRRGSGLAVLVGFFARSLAFRNFDVQEHPTFEDFARGLMAVAGTGIWDLQRRIGSDPNLLKHYPPRPLPGMTPGLYWAPPKEYAEIMAERRRADTWRETYSQMTATQQP